MAELRSTSTEDDVECRARARLYGLNISCRCRGLLVSSISITGVSPLFLGETIARANVTQAIVKLLGIAIVPQKSETVKSASSPISSAIFYLLRRPSSCTGGAVQRRRHHLGHVSKIGNASRFTVAAAIISMPVIFMMTLLHDNGARGSISAWRFDKHMPK